MNLIVVTRVGAGLWLVSICAETRMYFCVKASVHLVAIFKKKKRKKALDFPLLLLQTQMCSFIKEKNFFPSGGALTLMSFHQRSPKLFQIEMLNNDNESVGVNI